MSFFILVTALSGILWIVGALTDHMFLPGLPVSSLMAFVPFIAAFIFVSRKTKWAGIKFFLLKMLALPKKHKRYWIIPAVLLMPLIFYLSYLCLISVGNKLPSPGRIDIMIFPTALVFFAAAMGEEIGWSGYVLPRIQQNFGFVGSGILLGLFHAAWHYIPFIQAGRSLSWIAWQTLYLAATRIIIVWLYEKSGGNVLITAIFHATVNISWQLFPVQGSFYDPAVTGILTTIIAILVIGINNHRRLSVKWDHPGKTNVSSQ